MTAAKTKRPDRRLAPRPFPAHLHSALFLWLSSRAALPVLKRASRLSKPQGRRLAALLGEIEEAGAAAVAAALEEKVAADAEAFLAGVEAYRRHPFRRAAAPVPVLWREGTTRLLDYGGEGAPIFVVPSLINRYYVLDLLPEQSFLRYLSARGLRPLVVDWGAPGALERRFSLSDYISGRLARAFAAAREIAGKPLFLLGYCMGGVLALSLALSRQDEIAALLLLATPWDFHAGQGKQARLFSLAVGRLSLLWATAGCLPVELIQSFFFLLDPFLALRKFVRFAALPAASAQARRFVALEDWVNDGVPLVPKVAVECARSWYGDNEPCRGLWRLAGERVRPELWRRPCLIVLPAADRIVPPGSAAPLASLCPGASVLRPPLGHVGMMAALDARAALWAPLADWVVERAREGS
jgi:poly[(R)-3-hydroxyalkanoate] polymerase subunit PhaC